VNNTFSPISWFSFKFWIIISFSLYLLWYKECATCLIFGLNIIISVTVANCWYVPLYIQRVILMLYVLCTRIYVDRRLISFAKCHFCQVYVFVMVVMFCARNPIFICISLNVISPISFPFYVNVTHFLFNVVNLSFVRVSWFGLYLLILLLRVYIIDLLGSQYLIFFIRVDGRSQKVF
jgi:hypothetical protein